MVAESSRTSASVDHFGATLARWSWEILPAAILVTSRWARDSAAEVAFARKLTQVWLADGVKFVQFSLAPEEPAPEHLRACGFELWGELETWCRDLREPVEGENVVAGEAATCGRVVEPLTTLSHEELVELWRETMTESQDWPRLADCWQANGLPAGCPDPRTTPDQPAFLIRQGGQPAALILGTFDPNEAIGQITYLGTIPTQRRTGLAQALIEYFLAQARLTNLHQIYVHLDHANTLAKPVYLRKGFRISRSCRIWGWLATAEE